MIQRALSERFSEKWTPEPFSGCWLWTACSNPEGYGMIAVGRKMKPAPRISWELFRSEIPTGMCVLHKCDTPACVNPDHLFLGSKSDNSLDCLRKDRFPSAKLSVKQISEIRESTLTQTEIARQFGLHQTTIHYIRSGKHWKDI